MIVMALSTDGNQRYSWMKNSRSLFVKRTATGWSAVTLEAEEDWKRG
jgi:hypothetical protein